MNLNNLIKGYVNSKEKRPRKIGRYYTSELGSILGGYKKPEDFLKEEKLTLQSCKNIFEGTFREDAFKKMLDVNKIDYISQPKKVLKFSTGFEIVVVADFDFPDYILEAKCPVEMPLMIKPWNRHQLEAQYRAFKKDIYIGYFGARWENRIFKYVPDEDFWKTILKAVNDFHKKVEELNVPKTKQSTIS